MTKTPTLSANARQCQEISLAIDHLKRWHRERPWLHQTVKNQRIRVEIIRNYRRNTPRDYANLRWAMTRLRAKAFLEHIRLYNAGKTKTKPRWRNRPIN